MGSISTIWKSFSFPETIFASSPDFRERRALSLWQRFFAVYGKQVSRYQLIDLSDEMLADIGLTRQQAEAEAGKWFWQ